MILCPFILKIIDNMLPSTLYSNLENINSDDYMLLLAIYSNLENKISNDSISTVIDFLTCTESKCYCFKIADILGNHYSFNRCIGYKDMKTLKTKSGDLYNHSYCSIHTYNKMKELDLLINYQASNYTLKRYDGDWFY